MDKKRYKIAGIIFEIELNSNNYKLLDLFDEPQPYNLYINYNIDVNVSDKVQERIIINDSNDSSVDMIKDGIIINTNIKKIVDKGYNHQFSLFGNKGIIQNYILHVLESKYNCIILHGCALKNKDNKIIIGLGGSGSGKSVLINCALQKGWKLISTEQTIITGDMYIKKGNIYDNVSPLSEKLVSEKLDKAKIFKDRRLIEPIGQKIFVDLTAYQMEEDEMKIDIDKLTIVNVNFKGNGESITKIQDQDYLLRLLQSTSSEKICSPTIIERELINGPFHGDAKKRQITINKLINNNSDKIILSNGFEGFNMFLDKMEVNND